MLRGIKTASSGLIGKTIMATVMGVLAISFAIWGIGDIFRGFGRNAVAEIGSTEVSIEQFRQYYNERLQQVSRQLNRSVSPDQARALGLDRQILGQLVAEMTLDEQARKLRLGLSNADIAQRITTDPNFLGPNGRFDHARFEQIIRQAGYTEARFVQEQRSVMLRRQIATSISGDLGVPKTVLAAVNQYQNERRDIEFVLLGATQAGEIAAPTPEQLSAYYDERKILFRAPEYRKITLLPVSPDDLAKPDAISDADARAFYEPRKDSYGKPERREVRQIVFADPAEATAARERIVKGASFDDLVKERGLNASDTDLGTVAKADIIDPVVADAAFALKGDEVSEPVKGRFGTVLVKVGKIEPGEAKTYEDVAATIKRDLAQNRARAEINSLRDKVEDDRAGGATLTETAQKLGLKAQTFEAVDRAGRSPDGQPVAGLPRDGNVITAAFGADVGADSEALQLPSGGYLYYEVNGITPARDRSLDEIKPQVEARWRDDEVAKRLQAKSDELLGKIKGGATLAQIAQESGLTVQTTASLQRGAASAQTPAKLIDAVFKTAKDAVGTSEGESDTQRYLFRVTQVTEAVLDTASPQAQALSTNLRGAYADEVISQYIARLEADYGVKINQTALNQVVGGGTQ